MQQGKLCVLLLLVSAAAFTPQIQPWIGRDTTSLAAEEKDLQGVRGMKGYYRRPSRAIEKGGGFFVPGLEDEKIRIVSAAALIAAYALNRLGVQTSSLPQVVSELTGVGAALLLFADGVLKLLPPQVVIAPSTSSYISVVQSTFTHAADLVRLLAESLVRTVPGVQYALVVDTEGFSIELGPARAQPLSKDACMQIRKAALSFSSDEFVEFETNFLDRASAGGLVLPSYASTAVVARDARGWVWVLETNSELAVDTNASLRQWVSDLLSAPL